jgi:hypothetical protein
MKLFHHPIYTPIQSLTTPRRPNTSIARLTCLLRRNAFYPPCLPGSRSNNNAVSGLPRDLTATANHSFENKYGRTPDILQLAFPDLSGNAKGYFAPKPVLTHCGQRLEADFFEPEFNDISARDATSKSSLSSSQRSKLKKLKSFGGAIAGYTYIDVYTGHVDGILVNSIAKPLPLVKATVQAFKVKKHKVEVFSADQGVISL